MNNVYIKIDGIHCSNCEKTISKVVENIKNVKTVSFNGNILCLSYVDDIDIDKIIREINNLGYFTKKDYVSSNLNNLENNIKLREFIYLVIIILSINIFIKNIFGYNIFNAIPNIDSNITYSMLFLVGVLTSIHCLSMCGSISLMTVLNKKNSFKRSLLYNIGRVLSYTLLGGIVGLIGSVLSFNSLVSGLIILICSIIMFLMSLDMLGIVKFKIRFNRLNSKSRNSFAIGLLNGFMPCGVLQAMQVYALSTGSFIKGAISMFLFGSGTVPLMLLSSFVFTGFKGRKRIILNHVASVLLLILSISMMNRGLLSFNVDVASIFNSTDDYLVASLIDDYQVVEFDLSYDTYQDIMLEKDVPTKLIIHVDESYLTGCNNEIIIDEYNINYKLQVGNNVIEFIPSSSGEFIYTCSMNMIKNTIKVVDSL